MCQQIIQFCSGSTKALVFAGSFLKLVLATGLGYLACRANTLYQDIDPALAQSRSLSYHLQLAASAYLIIISVFACFAAHYDQKHSIRVLALLSSLNFLLAVAAIVLIPSGTNSELARPIEARLELAKGLYDFKQKPAIILPAAAVDILLEADSNGSQASLTPATLPNSTTSGGDSANKPKQKRMAADDLPAVAPIKEANSWPLNATTATELWDDLQARGCCGLKNSTYWAERKPKSCCSKVDEDKGEYFCKSEDEHHKLGCLEVIESVSLSAKNMSLLLMLALIALVSLYLANVTGISAYRTLHYSEASQSAYS